MVYVCTSDIGHDIEADASRGGAVAVGALVLDIHGALVAHFDQAAI